MNIVKAKKISILRVMIILALGVITGIQIALYLFDYFDDQIADSTSLIIGIAFLILSIGVVLFTFKHERSKTTR